MAKVKIREKDASVLSAVTSTSNVAYVPGYSKMGPTNTPTLCETYEDFVKVFGSSPFVYTADQTVDGVVVAKKGDFEKSWIYAAQLLKSGLPILFERVSNDAALANNKASSTLNFKVKSGSGDFTVNSTTYYVNDEKVYSDSSFTTEVTSLSFNYGTITDHTFTIDFDDSVVDSKEFTLVLSSGNYTVDVYGKTFGFNSETSKLTYNNEDVNTVDLTLHVNPTTVTLGSAVEGEQPTYTVLNLDYVIDASNYYTFTAKNQGAYGQRIQTRFTNSYTDTVPFVKVNLNDGTNYEEYLVTFDNTRDDYIMNSLANSKIVSVVPHVQSGFYVGVDSYRVISGTDTASYAELTYTGGTDIDYEDVLSVLSGSNSPFIKLADKLLYDVKFITSGAYPNIKENTINNATYSNISKRMLDAAGARGDVLALLDFEDSVLDDSKLSIVNALFPSNSLTENGENLNTFGTVITPNVTVYCDAVLSNVLLQSSFAYLQCFANSVRNNPEWLAIAGVNRGLVQNLVSVTSEISNVRMAEWQNGTQCINPIMNIRPYGYCIFGNRTLMINTDTTNLSSLSFTNVKVLNNELKKVVRQTCMSLMYESNDVVLWNTLKSLIEPTLDKMKTGRGLADYKLIRQTTTERATVSGILRIMPIEAVETFDIIFSIENSTVTVE